MTETLKKYHFTDAQIDTILRLVRNEAYRGCWDGEDGYDFDFGVANVEYCKFANLIEDQIVNHPTND